MYLKGLRYYPTQRTDRHTHSYTVCLYVCLRRSTGCWPDYYLGLAFRRFMPDTLYGATEVIN